MGTKVCKRGGGSWSRHYCLGHQYDMLTHDCLSQIRRLEHLHELEAIAHDAEVEGAAVQIKPAIRGRLSRRLLDVGNNLTWSQDSSSQSPESMFGKPRRGISPAGIRRLANRRRLEERHIRPTKSHPAWAASLSAGGVRPTLDIYVG